MAVVAAAGRTAFSARLSRREASRCGLVVVKAYSASLCGNLPALLPARAQFKPSRHCSPPTHPFWTLHLRELETIPCAIPSQTPPQVSHPRRRPRQSPCLVSRPETAGLSSARWT
ncbi:hypothetical protein FA95DRAFT_1563149 [Auriscalpium vulgare]|uniref:Uncharacterized protein n=1 Tax=Auriscalpium vulgare TaxID=40419 RepID=A0ACB8RIK6_9AGAM|nr:hypothetical protein FA95DRAFT_1563149 [Auriscalpium vulgare]